LFYENSDMINALVPNSDLNSKTLLPNRLYNAAFYGKPVIVMEKTFLAEQVSKYKLGLIINSFKNLNEKIIDYLNDMKYGEFILGRQDFFQKVLKDNENFRQMLLLF